MQKRLAAGVAIAVLATAISAVAAQTPFGRIAEAGTFDWRLASSLTPARQDIAIVEINESSVRALAPVVGRWPWPRLVHAGVINYLARARARAIIYDVQFGEADTQGHYRIGDRSITGPEADAELVAAVKQAGNVILLAGATFEGLERESSSLEAAAISRLPGSFPAWPGLTERPSIHPPFPELLTAASAVGHNMLEKDVGGVSRAMHPFVSWSGIAIPSLGMAAALSTKQVGPHDPLPLRSNGQLVLKIHGPYAGTDATTTFPVYSFFDVLLSEDNVRAGQPPPIAPEAFAGKIVFVGTSASGLADVHATAFGGNTPGVYLQATLADNVISHDFLRTSSVFTGVVITALAAALAALAVMLLPPWWALGSVVLGSVAGVGWATRLVHNGLWVPVFWPAVAAGLSVAGAFAWQYFVEGREKRAVSRLFGRYVSPAIYHQLMTNPAVARIGGERRVMSVLFSDIRGFTAASETGNPEAIVTQLNEYLGEMVGVLFRHQGTLDKFVGDQVMGLFGAPVEDPLHADHAVQAAVEMSATLDRLNARWSSEGRPTFEIGIGVNTGEMIAGNVGSEAIMSYTVIGDAVNLGARIESLNKEFGTRILISEATRAALRAPVQTRYVGDAAVKGRRETVKVHTVVLALLLSLLFAGSAQAQLGQLGGRIGQAKDALGKAKSALQELKFSDTEETQLGTDVSAKLRERYGVVQDAAVHKYVTLVGMSIAKDGPRPDLKWTFIVLDTDGINAFAAPGGFVHVTRGALALIRNESELAGVLAHEIGHVVARHTIKAIQKGKVEGALSRAATRSEFLQGVGTRLYEATLENSYDRGDEMEADKVAAPLSDHAGYNPGGLAAFLTKNAERNRNATERSGVFASHPETKARVDELGKMIKSRGLNHTALVEARYAASISYKLPDAGSAAPKAGGSYGVAGMSALGREKSSSSTIASAGSRGVNPDKDARGGPNKGLVVVSVTAAEIAEFKKGITG